MESSSSQWQPAARVEEPLEHLIVGALPVFWTAAGFARLDVDIDDRRLHRVDQRRQRRQRYCFSRGLAERERRKEQGQHSNGMQSGHQYPRQ